MFTIKRLKEERAKLVRDWRSLLEKAEKEKRGLTPTEKLDSDRFEAEIKEYDQRIGREEADQHRDASRVPLDRPSDLWGNSAPRSGIAFRDAVTGQEVRALLPTERVCREVPPIGIGNAIAALVTGRASELSAEQRGAMLGATDTGGGYLLAPQMSGMVVDLARSASVCLRAGAQTVPMSSAELKLARLSGDPTGYWRAEGVAVTSSGLTFDQIILQPKTLAAIVPVSLELASDASNAGQVIEGALQAALGVALDRACLIGDGVTEPT